MKLKHPQHEQAVDSSPTFFQDQLEAAESKEKLEAEPRWSWIPTAKSDSSAVYRT